MPKEKNEEMRLPSLDELFSSQEERDDAKLKRIYEIPISEIDPFPDHPFHVRDDEDMMNLVESVKANGVITPATVRKKEDGRYELLSGHRRMRACEIAGMDTLRCEVVDMDRDEATVFMVESNFQRTTILPSEKAFAYKMRLEAMNRQGKRTDLSAGSWTCRKPSKRTVRSRIFVTDRMQSPERRACKMCETIEVNCPEEMKKLIDEIAEGTVYSITMEVVLTNEQDQRKSK